MDCDILIIGAGIIGAALAAELAARRFNVLVLEAQTPGGGTSAAGMGHLVVLDDNPAELALSREGVSRWLACQSQLPEQVEFRRTGTLWLARNPVEMAEAERKQAFYQSIGLQSQLLTANQLYACEPHLAPGLAGALLRPDEAVIYPPAAVNWLLHCAKTAGAAVLREQQVTEIRPHRVSTQQGRVWQAERIVVAAGNASAHLLPGLPLKPRKGQLVITERYPGMVNHQLVALDYLQSAHGSAASSVAFNVQPRATGQLLIGSSRSFDDTSPEIDWPLMGRMLNAAFDYLPALRNLNAIRTWAGFRPSTPDKLPLLGPWPAMDSVWLATGHEGIGITTALASAALLADQLCDIPTALDGSPFRPDRFETAPVAEELLI
ncbi:glycine/D-amino acid oxidase-like deaminating enzyme [Chitinivorax tropicus]|uniref:Glycine/D-amino acid oxidase-like deaminating enzyme n=1 Tax=Chitinivorax tropicus TaxID=714531 RepID=A0A840MS21_9PROT|nr:FAD-dependent oxidoreductase [Chitinivorax tropicus]MBB5019063.1 glycine/D-amino acid oxidase-like deaminating enzyme [Chitinivorax tropicus]